MEPKRPRGREKHVTGSGKTVQRRGEGLNTGPVGDAGGYQDRRQEAGDQSGGTRSAGTRSGSGMKLLVLLAAFLLGGGGGLFSLLGGQTGQPAAGGQAPSSSQTAQAGQSGGKLDLTALLGGLSGSVSSGWQGENNTGRLDATVAVGAREKYTRLLGSGQDTATIMVYMCGTDLESRNGMGTADIQEMLAAKFGKNINLLLYTGGCSSWRNDLVSSSTNQIWQIKNGAMFCLEKNLGSVAMTDPATLTGYIQWCVQRFPASRYELILWDHGGGSITGYGYDEKFARSGSMDLAGIRTALENAGVKFDFIGFDACLMATAETALMLAQYGDYLIASEETEPGVGWYYTDWLTDFGTDTSMPTIQVGQKIVDSFVDTCAQKCPGQLTTLSVIDLAELSATLPAPLAQFSQSTHQLIENKAYQTVSDARSGSREFARSSKIDQVDLVHLAQNLGTQEGKALADAILGAVKYNRTSSNMTNAYGLSIYFPYQKASPSKVDSVAAAYLQIGMDASYTNCIRAFTELAQGGQEASGGSASSPLPALLGSALGGSGSVEDILQILLRLGAQTDRSTGLTPEEQAQYIVEHSFDSSALTWTTNADGEPILRLPEEQWSLIHSLELNLFYDDGEGFIDLGLDNVYDFDHEGNLKGAHDSTWLAIDEQPVAYYHTATVDDGDAYSITGRVPVMHNGQCAELILVFDNDHPYGFVAGVQAIYTQGETETIAKSAAGLEPGDTLEFLCDYYGYDGSYQNSYLLGNPLTVTEEPLTISNVPLEGGTLKATYLLTDLYNQPYWTPSF
ncbi:MAG: peptidase C11 [Lawsonibacter sp.]|nr:peptidase C11 [Lawsonibacter sp.]MCI8914158.1 peptidase C11 [Lawsonibacter sp.]